MTLILSSELFCYQPNLPSLGHALKHENPPRPLASKRVDLISNKLIKIKEKKPPLYPLQGPRGGVELVGFSPSPVSGIVAGQAEVILEIRALRPKIEPPIFRDRSLIW